MRRLCIALVCVPALAWAGNDESLSLGDDAALKGNAVAATVGDGSSLVYNPAGLAGAERDLVQVDGTVILLTVNHVPDLVTTTAGDAGDGSFAGLSSLPTAASLVLTLRPDLRLGLGLFSLDSSAATVDVPVEREGGAWRVTTTGEDSIYFASAGLGWRAAPAFRLGGSLSLVYVEELGMATAWSRTTEGGTTEMLGLGQVRSVSALGLTATLGAQWEVAPGWHLGLGVRAPMVLFLTALSGSEVTSLSSTEPPSADLNQTDLLEATWGLHQFRPLRARLGAAWKSGRTEVTVEGEVQPPMGAGDLTRERELTFNVRAGAIVPLTATQSLGFGAFTDLSPDTQPESLIESAIDFYGLCAGWRLDRPHGIGPGGKAPTLFFRFTLALRYTYGVGHVGGFEFAVTPTGGMPGEIRAAEARVHDLAVHIGSSVYF